ncbi:MAG: hypothetical protein ACREGB_02490, partial [Candidatus Saccharimonadales bacterium]
LVSTDRSLHSGTDATNRQQALSLAQQQVEFIKNALGTNDFITLQSYTGDTSPAGFCIDPSSGNPKPATDPACNNRGSGSQFNVVVTHATASDQSTVFKVTTTWPSTSSSTTDSLLVYYKVPGVGPTPPGVTGCSVSVTDDTAPGAATLSGVVNPNGKPTSWHFSYGTSLSFGTNVPRTDGIIAGGAGPTAVSQNISGLGTGTYYFTLVASNSDGNSSCSSIGMFKIKSPPPMPPRVMLKATPPSVSSGSHSTLSWTMSGGPATSCTASSNPNDPQWTTSTNPNPGGGSQVTSNLTVATEYTITCSGPGSPPPGTDSVKVNVNASSSIPSVSLISVTHDSGDDTYHVYGQVNPNNTADTHPYISIGRTCDSGGDADNPASAKGNAGINVYENPKGPFSDSTTHDERADMTDTQFSFYFCGLNDPYKFQQCAWWGTDIAAWLPNHVCSDEIDLYRGSGGGGGGGG